MMKPHLYLAGKIGKNDWRHSVVPRLRGHEWGDGSIETDDFIYVGPFFRACDHGCYHSPNSHGAISDDGCLGSGGDRDIRAQIVSRNNDALDRSDLVFFYVTTSDCHGTMIEFGYAISMLARPRIVVATSPDVEVPEFWYATIQADAVYENVTQCELDGLIIHEIAELKRLGKRAS